MFCQILTKSNRKNTDFCVVIIGVGPRGTYALERIIELGKQQVSNKSVEIILIEPESLGAGLIYNEKQPDFFLMNTIAEQVTAFPDSDTPLTKRPTLAEWLNSQKILTREQYSTRKDHGLYLSWVINSIIKQCPKAWSIKHIKQKAIDIENCETGKYIKLDSGEIIFANSILITSGNISSVEEKPIFKEHNDRLITKIFHKPYPTDSYVNSIIPENSVGIIGLGLTFIDVCLALTIGKGGQFKEKKDGTYQYIASGHEPKIFAWSRSGLPLRGKAVNQKLSQFQYTPRFLTVELIKKLKSTFGQLNFQRHLFPYLLVEMEKEFHTIAEKHNLNLKFPSWSNLINPLNKSHFISTDEFKNSLVKFLHQEIIECEKGNQTSPIKAACETLREVRDLLRYAIEYCGLEAASQHWVDKYFMSNYNFLCVGPPAFRLKEILALINAGVLNISFGPKPKLHIKNNYAHIRSTKFRENVECKLDVVINAKITPEKSILLKNLLNKKLIRQHQNQTQSFLYSLPTIEVSPNGFVIDKNGKEDIQLAACGPVAEGALWFTQVAARPYVNSRAIRDAQSWANSVINLIQQTT